MLKRLLNVVLVLVLTLNAIAATITGKVLDAQGKALPYASIFVKNGRQGTTAGVNGNYALTLPQGKYVLVAQYVGYGRQEKEIVVEEGKDMAVDFILALQQVSLNEVVVKAGGEDPAYEIIRNAIRKRKEYANQPAFFQCEVYTKGQLQLRDFPKKFMGQKVDFEDGDTSKRKMIYLSESLARYSVKGGNKSKIEVLSTRVSGQSNGFGFSNPEVISFYENNIKIGSSLNPRGFISPIADNALQFYRYRYEGSFFEDGKEVNKITVIHKRKYEPVFSGTINITEGDWRIHSLQLKLLKTSQMELVDTLRLEQLYTPLTKDQWVIRSQVIYPSVKFFGFDAFGSFVNVYSKFDIDPAFPTKFFDNTVIKYEKGSNKLPEAYWDSIRPLPLEPAEIVDYRKKDSLEQVRRDPHYLDSIDRKRNKLSVVGLLLTGQGISKQKRRENYFVSGLLQSVGFNTVEGWYLNLTGNYTRRLDSQFTGRRISIEPVLRYGFSNRHFNPSITARYNFGEKYYTQLEVSGGKKVFQLNNANPISNFGNSWETLFRENNFMKIYDAWYGRLRYTRGVGSGFTLLASAQYQDRMPLENTTDYVWRDFKDRTYSPNYPTDIATSNFSRHQAFILTAGFNWSPGTRYIAFPDRNVNIGSKYPSFSVSMTKGVKGILGSDVNYLKWRVGMRDDLDLKLGGQLRYRLYTGGFLQQDRVELPDLLHFNGNLLLLATNYLNSFQMLPYYKYSNANKLYGQGHLEYHLNGLLTNKIPGFRKLNWHLVGAANAFLLDGGTHYAELSLGLENIFKLVRADVVWGFEQGLFRGAYFRIAVPGILSGSGEE
ncbi:DUF5686 and carboxypeptidase regulatory-like domain-containing protein [Flavihumibacter rivuli]|uniref:DUF5686 and carboxypeptidase regulatory-like domain-containing protein n=1 Tax=Flavihumibacter rivuli TaxID=2838156 RepID=UPI001BDDD481|nr:DUF5686 and carboxypeptidase regulatory-like domain-containing protein [Flavihumibacter rivuli]ULQ57795.1 DUF5686 and carboxypeptidase regulatory-like domain-containing protein [Flavihumibacter rivuli]